MLFRDSGRFIGHYLGRRLRKLRIATTDFSRICVIGSATPQRAAVVNSSGSLTIGVPVDRAAFLAMTRSERTDHHLSLLRQGIERASAGNPHVPAAEILEILDEFAADGRTDVWLHKAGTVGGERGRRYAFSAAMDDEAFALRFCYTLDGVVISDVEVLRTPPDEISFHPLLGRVTVAEGRIRLLNTLGSPVFSYRAPP